MSALAPPWLAAASSVVATVPAWAAGALAVSIALLLLIEYRRTGLAGVARTLPRIVVAIAAFIAAIVLQDQNASHERSTHRRALEARALELTSRALVPGSAVACLMGEAGETVDTACEKAVFASPEAAASATAFVSARLSLLTDAAAHSGSSDSETIPSLSGLQRSLELDRYGVVAQVLAIRDGCTADKCAAFALFSDTNIIKSNLKARVFEAYVSRYAATWASGVATPAAEKSAEPAGVPQVRAPDSTAAQPPVASRYDFPSSKSIPPVSIMAAEPPLPNATKPPENAAPATGEPAAGSASTPVPPKRPQGGQP